MSKITTDTDTREFTNQELGCIFDILATFIVEHLDKGGAAEPVISAHEKIGSLLKPE